jgi:hypothetical protein
MKWLFSVFLFFLSHISTSQTLSTSQRDSLRQVVHKLIETDQRYRNLYVEAQKKHDEAAILKYGQLMHVTDSINFHTLEGIIKNFGFPSYTNLGKGTNPPFIVLNHWSKQEPEWFNSPEMVRMLKAEVDKGNLPLQIIDLSHMLCVSFMNYGTLYAKIINDAREVYGLKPYTEKQFLHQESIDIIEHK